jgi:flagellin-like hook-associated protein FlgL
VGLRISTNLLSLNVQRNLATTTRALQRTMQRLASGSRINTGRDDPAGLAMATGLEAQRRGLIQAVRNVNDSRGFLETADGAIAEQAGMIQRMRELAVQASNGTLSDSTRRFLDTECQQLLAEFTRLTTQTQFNGVNLLDGSFGTKNIQVGSQKGHTLQLGLASMQSSQVFAVTSTTTVTTSTVTQGTGTFQARRALQTNFAHVGIKVNDFNGDGKLDYSFIDYGDSFIYVTLGNGNGTFGTAIKSSIVTDAGDIGAADVNGDGKIDLIAPDSSDVVIIALGNGNGTFLARTTIAVPTGNALTIVTADLNGDGKIDLITPDGLNNVASISLGNGNGTFKARTTIDVEECLDMKTADLNGDGKLDIVSADFNAGTDRLEVLLGNGNGTFLPLIDYPSGNHPKSVAIADVNGDGKLDLISGSSDDQTADISLGNGNGTFKPRTTVKIGTYPVVDLADLNGDGKMDIVANDYGTGWISICFGNGNGTFNTRVTIREQNSPESLTLADMNGDGVADILALNPGGGGTSGLYLTNTTTVPGGTAVSTTISAAAISLGSQSSAQDSLAIFDTALAYVNSVRANIGALQSRLDFVTSVNMNTAENVSAARSQIMDTDMAEATAEFARLDILQKAGIAVLGQANLATQLSLKILEGL